MSNHIDHIEITNFKSIRHQKIEGCKRINVFIGYPNVGKSAILEAISSLCYLQKDYNDPYSDLCRVKNTSELFFNGNIGEDIVIKYSNKVVLLLTYLSEKEFDLDIRVDDSYNEKNNVQEAKFVHDDAGLVYPLHFKKISFSIDSLKSLQSAAKKDIIKVRKYIFKNLYSEVKTNGLNFFFPYGKNLVDIIQFNKELRKEVIELFKFYNLRLNIDLTNNSIKGLKQIDDETIFTIPFYQMADTLQRLIFHKAAILSNQDTVLLFEEPEAHMFPPYIRKFTQDIIFSKDNGNQYFISTHSPFVIDDLVEDAREDLAVFLVGLKNGETIIKRLTDEELEEVHKLHVDLFFNIESYLD